MGKAICSVDDCERTTYAKGWCQRHYALARRNGAPVKVKVRGVCSEDDCEGERYGHGLCLRHWRAVRSRRRCSIPACDSPEEARGWCSRHYNRWKRHGDPLWERPARVCEVVDCDCRHVGHGYCIKHLERWRKHGDPLHEFEYERRPHIDCAVVWCDDDSYARGWCRDHYYRWRRHGNPTHIHDWEVVNGKRRCPRCGTMTPQNEWAAPWCRPCKREYQNDRGHARRALQRATASGKFTRREVMDRDDWICGICSEPVDPSLRYPHPLSQSLDHIVPISRGGAHVIENCQASHLFCNLSKHARV